MGKPKKGKKGRQDEDFGDDDVDLDPLAQPPADEEVEVTKPSGGKKAKKGKKKKDDDWEDDVASEIAALSLEANKDAPEDDVANGEVEELKPKKKEKKKKKKAQKEEEDEEEEGDNDTDIMVQALGKKGNKAMSAFQMLDIEGSENEEQEEEDSKPAKMDKEKKVNKNLSVEETETAQVETEETSQTASKQQGKKNKKGKKDTKKVAEEEDIDALLAEIEKPAEKTGKKGKKKKQTENEMEVEAAAVTPEAPGGTTEVLEEASGDTAEKELAAVTPEDLELEFQDEDKPKKSKKVENDAAAEEDEGEEHTVKTAAQKKKEKKERQKQQKLLEKQKGKKKKDVEKEGTPEADTAEPTVQAVSETTEGATEAVEGAAAEAQASDDEGEDGDKKKKKDKRKKKKDKDKDKDEDKGKKKPAKAQIKAMQEALLKIKEEEERLKREEEEKERRLEEARREKEEQERLEKERKEKKKQKDKERIQKLKAEGKYLTPKQREAQRRAQQMLEAMRAQGLEIPMKEEGEPQKKKRVVYEKKKKRPQQQQAAEQVTPSPEDEKKIEVEETPSEQEEKAEGKPEPEPSVEEEEAKEAWDLSDDEEEETDATDAKPEVETKTEEKKIAAKPEETEDTEEEEEEDDDEEESEEESEDDDEDEEDSEEDSDSEEESDDDGMTEADRRREKALARIKKRKEDAEARRTTDELRAPVVCVMGHVDTGKTKILDKLRRTNVQDGEAGGITQQIGATNVPVEAIREQTKMCKEFAKQELKLPGLLIIDTPGHESFSNLRSRGSSLCDIAILVVDIMHGLEPQTIESINLLKQKKTPFIVALNKIDRLYQWRSNPHSDVVNNLKKQQINTKQEFEERVKEIVVQFAQEGLNAALFHENKNTREYLSMVPTSAHSGDGMGNLIALICDLTQNLLAKRLAYSDELQATTMEVKALPGLGTTVDVILVNGKLKEMDTVILAGTEGPIVTQLRGVLTPQPMRELRVKANYIHHKEVRAAQGVKLIAKDLEKALAGMPMYVAEEQDEIEIFKEEIANVLKEALSSIKVQERGVFVQASTLGSLEALLEFLRTSKIPYAGINIGPVHKKDVMKASIMLEHDSQYATILAFDVKVEREAQELADSLGVKIFHADIIYHLFDKFMAYRDEIKAKKREEFKYVAVFPCKIRIMPQYVFNSRDPIVVGVMVEAGFVKEGTPLCVPTKEFVEIGRVVSIENNHKAVDEARKGQEVCLKIEAVPGEAPKMYGRHFDYEDMLVSKITRQSIDAVKDYFREDMTKADWQLIMELKKTFEIL